MTTLCEHLFCGIYYYELNVIKKGSFPEKTFDMFPKLLCHVSFEGAFWLYKKLKNFKYYMKYSVFGT